MKAELRAAAIGGVGGAVLAVAVVFGLASMGYLPGSGGAAIHDYLMAHPDVLVDMSTKLQTQQQQAQDAARQAAVDKVGLKAFFNPKIAFITGPKDAKTTFVEFFDYNCPYCRLSNPTVQAFYKKQKDKVRFAFIEFPIKGPDSDAVARIALAARKQPDKYLDFHFAVMGSEDHVDAASVLEIAKKVGLDLKKLAVDEKDPSIAATIAAGHALAEAASVDGTPAFIINGKIREGAVDQDALKAMVKG
jgi:protein-disulfide isomerase